VFLILNIKVKIYQPSQRAHAEYWPENDNTNVYMLKHGKKPNWVTSRCPE